MWPDISIWDGRIVLSFCIFLRFKDWLGDFNKLDNCDILSIDKGNVVGNTLDVAFVYIDGMDAG